MIKTDKFKLGNEYGYFGAAVKARSAEYTITQRRDGSAMLRISSGGRQLNCRCDSTRQAALMINRVEDLFFPKDKEEHNG